MRLKDNQDEASWEEFVATYRNYILTIITNLKVSHHDAEDLLQSILLKFWNKLPELNMTQVKVNFVTGLDRSPRMILLNFLIRKKRRKENSSDETEYEEPDPEDADIDKMIDREWQAYISEKAWEYIKKNFGEKVLEVFMCFADGLTGPQVSQKMAMAENTCYVYKLRVQKSSA